MMICLVFVYVWQNIEVIRIELDYRKLARTEKKLVKENDNLRYEIEKYRQADVVDRYASGKGYRIMTPRDIDVIDTGMDDDRKRN